MGKWVSNLWKSIGFYIPDDAIYDIYEYATDVRAAAAHNIYTGMAYVRVGMCAEHMFRALSQ